MGNAYYGRRRAKMGSPLYYGQRTATYGVCPESVEMVTEQNGCDVLPAMAYVPIQQWSTPYAPEVGFSRGTVFADLDKPFMGGGCSCGM